jgi:hypothetical protein
MSQAYVTVDKIINDYIMSIDADDFGSNASDYMLRQYALRGIREFNFDMAHNIKTTTLDVNQTLGTVELPADFVDMVKIGQLGSDGLVYIFAENKNMNLLPDQPADAMPDYLLGFDSYVFRNFIYESTVGRLYGMGGGQGAGEYRINWAENRIEISLLSDTTKVVLEYISDAAKSDNPCVPVYAEEALRAYIYFKVIQRKASVPLGEKARARSEYYNERRLANARLKSFNKFDALSTSRRNFKLSPKA